MRKKKFQMNWYQLNDTAAMEQKMEKMAAKGWLLDKVTNLGWRYRRAEPCDVKYTVTFFPKASIFDGGPTGDQMVYTDYCAAAGWEFVSAYGPMQYFRSTRPDPTPIETDEGEKLRAIHKSMLKTAIFGYGLLIFSMLLNLSTRLSNLSRDIVSTLTSLGDMALLMLIFSTLIYLVAVLVDYFFWYRGSKKAVARGEACLQPHTQARLWGGVVLVGICAAAILISISEVTSLGKAWIWLYAFGGMALLLIITQSVMALMKRKGCSRKATRAVFIILCILLSIAYAGGMFPLAMKIADNDLLAERQPAYVYTSPHGTEWDIFHDELPVTLEDLGYTVTEEDHCSYKMEEDSSFLLSSTRYSQRAYGSESELPSLNYEVVVGSGKILDLCWESLWGAGERYTSTFASRPVDPTVYGAEDAFYNPFPHGYCLRFSDRIIILDQADELTEAQRVAAVQKLLSN